MRERERVTRLITEAGYFARTSGGRTLTLPDSDLEWQLRYGSWGDLEKERYRVASLLNLLSFLVSEPEKPRNNIVRLIREAQAMKEPKGD